jgi:phosphate starvation-inducible PhoH-like protein
MNDAQPRPSQTDGPDGTQLPTGAGSGGDTPVLTRQIPPPIEMVTLLGPRDELLRTMERQFPLVDTHVRGNEMTFSGPAGELDVIDTLLDELLTIVSTGQPLNRDAVERSISMLRGQTSERPADVLTMNIVSSRGRTIRPKTLNQKRYVDAIDEHTVVFGIGPAGTGKTYLAMAKAVAALQAKQVNRIILTRPAVEAGERLGFLPGTLNDKIDPYLRPLYDALHDMVSPETIPRLMASGTIEVAPLAYMRGRTLNDAFIILDEAQNTSSEQMKMFLTRLGFGSKMVVTGDITQVDLPGGTRSGLRVVRDILEGVEDVHFAELTSHDVVRHRLVSAIVDAYERDEVRAERRARTSGARADHRDHRDHGDHRGSRRGPDRAGDRAGDRGGDRGGEHRDERRDDDGGRRDVTEAGA